MECFIGINWFSIEMMYIQFDLKEICNLYTICLYRVTDMSSLDKQQRMLKLSAAAVKWRFNGF